MKNICFFTPSLSIGGIEKVLLTFSEGLIKKGYNVTYIITHEPGVLAIELPLGLKVITLGGHKLRYSIIYLIKFLKKNQQDIIITGGNISNALLILIIKIFKINSKLIISQHNYNNIERSNFLSFLIIKYLYKYSDEIIAISSGIKNYLLSYGLNESKITVIYNPIDIVKINEKSDEILNLDLPEEYISFVGRLGKVKNIELLIDAFRIVSLKNDKIKLLIVGDGPEKRFLIEKTLDLHLESKVFFLGSLNNPYPIIKNSKLGVLSSFSEALPIIILENFALSVTFVSTPNQGALELLENGLFGYLSNTMEVRELAKSIEKALAYPISEIELKKKALEFDVNIKLEELIRLFFKLNSK
jgi:glycosyltransferase involved in cell wall biosynthesis